MELRLQECPRDRHVRAPGRGAEAHVHHGVRRRGIANIPGQAGGAAGLLGGRDTDCPRTNIVAFQHALVRPCLRAAGLSAEQSKWDAYWGRYTPGYRETYYLIGPAEEGWPLFPAYHALRLLFQTTQRGWQVVQVAPWAEDDWRLFDDAGARIVDQPEKEIAAYASPNGELTLMGLDTHGRALNTTSDERPAYSIGGLPAEHGVQPCALERDRERRELARRHGHDGRSGRRPLRGAAPCRVRSDDGSRFLGG